MMVRELGGKGGEGRVTAPDLIVQVDARSDARNYGCMRERE